MDDPITRDRPIAVAIIDDQPIVRRGYHDILAACPDVWIAYNGASYEQVLAREDAIDLVLLDLYPRDPLAGGQPNFAALEAFEDVLNVLVISAHARDEDVFDVMHHFTVLGYVTKSASEDELRAAVRRAATGGLVMTPELAGVLLRESNKRTNVPHLPPAQQRILELVAEGCINRQIAEILGLSEATVPKEISKIRQALGATSREDSRVWLAKRAEELGLVGDIAKRRRRLLRRRQR